MTMQDPKADLAHIRRLMDETRQAASLSGGYFILWGVVASLGLIATWMHAAQIWGVSPMLSWTACLIVGGIGMFFLVRRDLRQPVDTPAGRLVGTVWQAFGVSMLVLFFAGAFPGTLDGRNMPALTSTLIGAAVFLTGALTGLSWLRLTALGWWAGAVVMFVWPGIHVLWLMGVMLLLFYIVPGLVLIKKRPALRELSDA